MPAPLFDNVLHLARRHALHIHLQHGRNQRLFAALVSLKHFRAEPPLPVLRHSQLDLADSRDKRPAVMARLVAEPALTPLAPR